jgi:hypothetical protein
VITVACWKWKRPDTGADLFGPEYVNRLRAALERNLQLRHEVVCVTDDPSGIDSRVRIVPLPETYAYTPRCRRRMQLFSRKFAEQHLGRRILSIDLDVVVVGDLTPLLTRTEPLVCWRVGYAQVFSGSFLLMDAGVLDQLWREFSADPERYPRRVAPTEKVPSDQAMMNAFLRRRTKPVPQWTERDGFVTYFGGPGADRGRQHLGVGPDQPRLPRGARLVVLGSADKAVMDEGRYDWVREHWTELPAEAA